MKKNYYQIFIAGSGQLGSRYLQGLLKSNLNIETIVFDTKKESLALAKESIIGSFEDKSNHKVHFIEDLKLVPTNLDLAIISTPADSRKDAVQNLTQKSSVSFWILEKVLAQNAQDLTELIQFTLKSKRVWVNFPRRVFNLYKKLKIQLLPSEKVTMKVQGKSWGLACNALHFIDLLTWLTGESLVSIDTTKLNRLWVPSKREGYWEIDGNLTGSFSNGSLFELHCNSELSENIQIELIQDSKKWDINEGNGECKCSNGDIVKDTLPYQSGFTAEIVDKILLESKSDLPNLEEAVHIHRIFLDALLLHWNQVNKKKLDLLPIT